MSEAIDLSLPIDVLWDKYGPKPCPCSKDGYFVDFACVECKNLMQIENEAMLNISIRKALFDTAKEMLTDTNSWYIILLGKD